MESGGSPDLCCGLAPIRHCELIARGDKPKMRILSYTLERDDVEFPILRTMLLHNTSTTLSVVSQQEMHDIRENKVAHS